MNQKQKLKEFKDNIQAIDELMQDDNLRFFDIEDYTDSMFGVHISAYRRNKCTICNELINLNEFYVYPTWHFFHGKANDTHLKCFYTKLKENLSSMENWIQFANYNIKDEDFNLKELEIA